MLGEEGRESREGKVRHDDAALSALLLAAVHLGQVAVLGQVAEGANLIVEELLDLDIEVDDFDSDSLHGE